MGIAAKPGADRIPADSRVESRVDARILLELAAHPRASAVALADATGIARNTAQTRLARLARLEAGGALGSFGRRVEPAAALGYPLTAFITALVTPRRV